MLLTTGTAVAVRNNPARTVLNWLSCIRLGEVLVLQGTPLFGALFAMQHLTVAGCGAFAWLAIGSTLLLGHVFVLNDWAGISGDLCDPNRVAGVFTTKAIPRHGMVYLSLVLLALSLSVLAKFGYSTLLITVVIALLSALYSFPGIHAKGVPVMNSALHFVGGLGHFLLGYSVFSGPDWRGIQIGSFFALVFVAGHLTHETRDRDADLLNGIRTNAVTFGKLRSFISGLILFAIADALLVALALRNSVPRPIAGIVVAWPLHAYWVVQISRAGLTFENIRRLQKRYRILYAAKGLLIVASVLIAQYCLASGRTGACGQ